MQKDEAIHEVVLMCLGNANERPLCVIASAKKFQVPKVEQLYTFFRVKTIPTIAPIKINGANLTNSHSNE